MKIGNSTCILLCLVQFVQVVSWCNNTESFLMSGWKKYNGALYKKFGGVDLDYTNWEMYCQSYGGSLATAKTSEENNFVFSILTYGRGVIYIGLKNDGVNWMWNDGTPVIYTNWTKDEYIGQSHMCAYVYVDTWWSPIACSTTLVGGVCKCPIPIYCNATSPCSNPYAECKSGICQCMSGYTLSGTLCTADFSSPCDTTNGCINPYASCIDGYCQCRLGYSKIGDHCKADVGIQCDNYYGCSNPSASCKDTCQCKSGYNTDGSFCKAALGSECDVNNGCFSFNADCTNGTCQCMSGYKLNGTDCKSVPSIPEYHKTPVAWIVGGTIIGLVVILLVVLGIFLWRRLQNKQQTRHVKGQEKSMKQEESAKMKKNTRQNATNGQEFEGQHLTGAETSQDRDLN